VEAALAELVLPMQVVELAGFAAFSGRSLFIHGPPGQVRRRWRTSSTTRSAASSGSLTVSAWTRTSFVSSILAATTASRPRCRRGRTRRGPPLGLHPASLHRRRRELTIKDLELTHSHARGYYEAPVHLKANGGTFLLDDFGRQRIEPRLLLNR